MIGQFFDNMIVVSIDNEWLQCYIKSLGKCWKLFCATLNGIR